LTGKILHLARRRGGGGCTLLLLLLLAERRIQTKRQAVLQFYARHYRGYVINTW
jgi:hypothetical protein